jgi:hypothetical protein
MRLKTQSGARVRAPPSRVELARDAVRFKRYGFIVERVSENRFVCQEISTDYFYRFSLHTSMAFSEEPNFHLFLARST